MSDSSEESETRLVVTRDGSHTVYSPRFDQHFHNPNGAVAESRYVFFEQTGLMEALAHKKKINILEIGFGTGLNLMLLLDYHLGQDSPSHISYYSVEGFPLSSDIAADLNYEQFLRHPEINSRVTRLFSRLDKGMNRFSLGDRISVHLFNGLFEDFPHPRIDARYVFHDAFSPDTNPELWTGRVFKKIADLSADDVLLSTYCAASRAKGAMAWAGWKLAKTQGALGKREMTLAALDPDRLGPLKRINEERLARRYEEDDFD